VHICTNESVPEILQAEAPGSALQWRRDASIVKMASREFTLTETRKMCRNIKMLFNFNPPVTDEEIRAASLQFVRKISGFNKPSKANEAAFLAAIDEVASASSRLLRSLET